MNYTMPLSYQIHDGTGKSLGWVASIAVMTRGLEKDTGVRLTDPAAKPPNPRTFKTESQANDAAEQEWPRWSDS
jgi:hypothetical protein